MRTPHRIPRSNSRRGITAVLAMLYLALFSTLALGFYASVTIAVQIAGNEQRTNRSLLAAESGMAFMKYHLANLGVPPNTATDQLFTQVYNRFGTRLNGYYNMNGQTVGINGASDLISIPGGADTWISADDGTGSQFRATIEKMQNGQQLRVKVVGRFKTSVSNKATQLDYSIAKDAAKIFNYGVASKSAIAMSGNVTIQGTPGNDAMGSVLSATTSTSTPLTMSGNAKISGDVSFTNSSGSVSAGSNTTIAGLKPTQSGYADHVHAGVGEVPFPIIDTAAFEPFVPSATATGTGVINTGNPSGTSFKNIRIKANANPTFNANTTIQGVVWIEMPNQVKFNGQANIQGVIVVPTDTNNNSTANLTQNIIEFKGGVTATGIQTLPATTDFPAAERALTGSLVLAPGFDVKFGGNFGTIAGSIIGSQLDFSGTAGGTIKGSVINIRDSAMSVAGTTDIIIESQGTSNYPAGVFFGSHYAPLPQTYAEVAP